MPLFQLPKRTAYTVWGSKCTYSNRSVFDGICGAEDQASDPRAGISDPEKTGPMSTIRLPA
jgi:hypothetical protein